MRKPALRKPPLAFSIFTLLFLTAPADSSARQPGGVQTDQMTPAQREAQIQRLDKRIKELEKLVKEREQRAKKWHRRADRTEAQGFDARLPYGSGSRNTAEDWEQKAAEARGELEKAKEERERLKRGGATPAPTGEPNPDSGPGAGTAPPKGSPEAVPEPVAPTPQEVEPRPDTKPTEQMPAPPADQPAGPSRRDLEKQIKDAEKAGKKSDQDAKDNDRRANSWTRRAEDAERIGRTEQAEENRRIAEGFRKDAEKNRQEAAKARAEAEEARRKLADLKSGRVPSVPAPPAPPKPGSPDEPIVPGLKDPPERPPSAPGAPPSGEAAPKPPGGSAPEPPKPPGETVYPPAFHPCLIPRLLVMRLLALDDPWGHKEFLNFPLRIVLTFVIIADNQYAFTVEETAQALFLLLAAAAGRFDPENCTFTASGKGPATGREFVEWQLQLEEQSPWKGKLTVGLNGTLPNGPIVYSLEEISRQE